VPSDLVAAIIRNDARAVDALLASGADPNAADADGVTPLMAAASERADERIAKALIARGADVNATDRWGETALHMAVGRGDPSLVVLFLDHGADVKRRTRQGQTPLLMAMKRTSTADRIDIMARLLERGADANDASEMGQPVLILACAQQDLAAVKLLVAHGADVNATSRGESALSAALDRPDIVEFLLSRGAHIGSDVLLRAAGRGDTASIEQLLKHGGTVDTRGLAGQTMLMAAAERGQVAAMARIRMRSTPTVARR